MKSHLEVAKDAVRSAGLEELADNLEWAAAAASMRPQLEADLRRLREFNMHFGLGPVDEAIEEMRERHRAIGPQLGGNRIPPRPPFGPGPLNATEVTLGPAPVGIRMGDGAPLFYNRDTGQLATEADMRPPFPPIPAGIPDGAAIFTSTTRSPTGEPVPRVSMADGTAWELRPIRLMDWVQVAAASPQPPQPQPEDDSADE